MWSKKQEENPQGVVHFFSNISFSSCSRCRLSITLSCICHRMSNNGCMRQLCFFHSSKFWKFVHTGPKADGHFCFHLSHVINYKLLLAAALSWNFFFFSKINIDSFFFSYFGFYWARLIFFCIMVHLMIFVFLSWNKSI